MPWEWEWENIKLYLGYWGISITYEGKNYDYHLGFGPVEDFWKIIVFRETKYFITNHPWFECHECDRWIDSREYEYLRSLVLSWEEQPNQVITEYCTDCRQHKRVVYIRLPRLFWCYRYEEEKQEPWD